MIQAIQNRRSIRKYQKKMVEPDKIQEILEAAVLAPSGSNTQPWRFLIITDEEKKKEIAFVDHNQKWMLSAPVFIVCMADLNSRVERTDVDLLSEESSSPELKQIIRDTSNAISNILLEATNQGLGSCWTAWYEQEAMHKVIKVPNSFYICGVVTVGYADEVVKSRPRKSVDEVTRFEEWM